VVALGLLPRIGATARSPCKQWVFSTELELILLDAKKRSMFLDETLE